MWTHFRVITLDTCGTLIISVLNSTHDCQKTLGNMSIAKIVPLFFKCCKTGELYQVMHSFEHPSQCDKNLIYVNNK